MPAAGSTTATTTIKAGVKVAVSGSASGDASYGVHVTGSIIPPNFNAFQFQAGMDLDVSAKLSIDASVSVSGFLRWGCVFH